MVVGHKSEVSNVESRKEELFGTFSGGGGGGGGTSMKRPWKECLAYMSQQINRKGWLVRSLNLLTTELSVKRTGEDQEPGRLGKRETTPNTTLSPPQWLLH